MLISVAAAEDLQPTDHCGDVAPEIRIAADASGTATLTVFGVQGSVVADGAASGNGISYTFSNPALTSWIQQGNDPFVCVSGNADGDHFYGPFPGKVLRLTASNATAALATTLRRRYGSSFITSQRKWMKCPQQELLPLTGDHLAMAACRFEFGTPHGQFVGGSVDMALLGGAVAPYDKLASETYRKDIQSCPIPPNRSGWANGVSLTNRRLTNTTSLVAGHACRWLIGPTGMAGDIESDVARQDGRIPSIETVGFHGTNLAGFEDMATFRCRISRVGAENSFDCRNRLGDRFVYSFTVSR
jgi:hypothetical protein